ncbi:HAMP domain-containing histidine kinase [bacterium]|nr:HAMP domain-containing histidine kinase [bacterium]
MAKHIWSFDLDKNRYEAIKSKLKPKYILHKVRDVNELPDRERISALIIDPEFGDHFCEAIADYSVNESIPLFVWTPIGNKILSIAYYYNIHLLPVPFSIEDIIARLGEVLDTKPSKNLLAAIIDDTLADSLTHYLRKNFWKMTRIKGITPLKKSLENHNFDAILSDLDFIESAIPNKPFEPRPPLVVLAPFDFSGKGAFRIDDKTAFVSSKLDPEVLADIIHNLFLSSSKTAVRELSYLKALKEASANARKAQYLTDLIVKVAKDETQGRRAEELNLLNIQTKGLVSELFETFENLIKRNRLIYSVTKTNNLPEDIFLLEEQLTHAREIYEALRSVEWFKRTGAMEHVNLTKLINHAATKVRANRRRKEINWDFDLSEIGLVSANLTELEECFINIFTNAYEAIDTSGTIKVRTKFDGVNMKITIEDDGRGIQKDIIPNVTRPYFTTKSTSHAGLGLTIARGIIKYHGGKLDIDSTLHKGTKFTITLPSTTINQKAAQKIDQPIDLLIVSHQRTLGFLEASLIKYGIKIEVSDNTGEALKLLRKLKPKAILVMAAFGFLELDGLRMLVEAKGNSKLILFDPTESIPKDLVGLDSLIKGSFPLHHLLAIVNSYVEA